ncbi:MAG TPA: 5-amino-6-(D-ribitylamino)uracil--L-tyrosine 4-hydroxyphenyl transferase CofH [Methanomicrobiales archaeon]|nr:5-amino-6-(D-ribitylamino)uracil--L-tyrosine 4-hydroxyphenyl transferase CofH [Methanomicrobiales archaeon]
MVAGIRVLLRDVAGGHRLTEAEALRLMGATGRDVWAVAGCADRLREERVGEAVTYVRNQNLNVTNICVNSCGFCGFSRKRGDPDAYFLDRAAIQAKAARARERKATEICTVSGLHPDFTADSYVDILTAIREAAPGVHLHASNPMEVAYGAARSGISTAEMAGRLKAAGLGSMCGTAAEILVDRVRSVICPGKIDTASWERIIREVHGLGIPTTATIMYGHCETVADRARHLGILRGIQDDTGGFTEFVPLSFIHMETPLFRKGLARAGATGREDLLMIAVSRLFLDNIPHIQSSWVKLGRKLAQLGLVAGADDLGGTMYEESISKGAGAKDTEYLDPAEMERMAEDLGRPLRQRTTLYTLL